MTLKTPSPLSTAQQFVQALISILKRTCSNTDVSLHDHCAAEVRLMYKPALLLCSVFSTIVDLLLN